MKKIILVLLLISIVFAAFLFLSVKNKGDLSNKVCFKNNCFNVELANNKDERLKGLMYKKSLSEKQGMLFIFEKEDIHPFWMKNTFVCLDIIWIDKDKKVVFISKNNKPCRENFCQSIIPDKRAKYVLEIKGGLADKIGLRKGDYLKMSINDK